MKRNNVIFFGSTDDSLLVLNALQQCNNVTIQQLSVVAVITQPPRPVGRKQVLTPTPVEIWAKAHNVTILSFPSDHGKPWLYASERQVADALEPLKADLIVSACYGQMIPLESIHAARFGGLNVHPSILPRWRGADPVPWAILTGDHQSGVTVVTLGEKFDDGRIIAQKKVPIKDSDTSDALRTKLFTLGAGLLVKTVPDYIDGSIKGALQQCNNLTIQQFPYARRLTRDDGFEPWEAIQKALIDVQEAKRIDRKFRAFMPWPGVWTLLRPAGRDYEGQAKERRMKILGLSLVAGLLSLDVVQLEGKNSIPWKEFTKGHELLS